MKYVVLIGDGMADMPLRDLGDKTPLQYARTPSMDVLTQKGVYGMVRTIPQGMHPGSDVANLSILGYNPSEYYSGRAPLEAASMGIELLEDDVAYRCNLVTLKHNADRTRAIMEDYSGGHITTEESRVLIDEIHKELGSDAIAFYPGISYRHLMIWSKGSIEVECVPPHDIIGRDIMDYLPVGEGEEVLRKIMMDSLSVLARHPVNMKRINNGERPGNSIWLWGQGKKPSLPTFRDKYSLEGALVSAVDLTKGLGIYAGFRILKVPGVTGYLDTNYEGKAEAALKALRDVDFVYVHVEAPDEAGHSGAYGDKIRAIEDFDTRVVAQVMAGMKAFQKYRILLLPDHPTPVALKTHTDTPVPFVMFDNSALRENKGMTFDEGIGDHDDAIVMEEGFRLMDSFINGELFTGS
ncbi:MAG: cofactor-independent phosphoglycerate mutase [Nitrospiraceae bacterium]|jgi:2,3-bisphosphoglycerate-independent phosphoglycerate mutase|nr:MAG: cofactor-independent phosphoglycerate mutase [Nitrospiraceae bacterium]